MEKYGERLGKDMGDVLAGYAKGWEDLLEGKMAPECFETLYLAVRRIILALPKEEREIYEKYIEAGMTEAKRLNAKKVMKDTESGETERLEIIHDLLEKYGKRVQTD